MATKKIIEWKGADGVMYTCCEKVIQKKQDDGSWFQFKPGQLMKGEDGEWYEIACTIDLDTKPRVGAGEPTHPYGITFDTQYGVRWSLHVQDEHGQPYANHGGFNVTYSVKKLVNGITKDYFESSVSVNIPNGSSVLYLDRVYTKEDPAYDVEFIIILNNTVYEKIGAYSWTVPVPKGTGTGTGFE